MLNEQNKGSIILKLSKGAVITCVTLWDSIGTYSQKKSQSFPPEYSQKIYMKETRTK